MNSNGKKARKQSGLSRFEVKRATRKKRHATISDPDYNPNVGTNARATANAQKERR
jgi:hypothetical protein